MKATTTATKSAAKKSTAKKSTAKKVARKKAPSRKATDAKKPAPKKVAKKAPAKKAGKAVAKKAVVNKTINSLVMVRLVTSKPAFSAKLEKTHRQVVKDSGAVDQAVRAPLAKLFATKDTAIAKAANTINMMAIKLRKRGLPVPNMEGATYQRAKDIPAIMDELDDHTNELETALKLIKVQYADLMSAGQAQLKVLADEICWPTAEEFVAGFKMDLIWYNQPQAIQEESVLGAVTKEVAAKIKATSVMEESQRAQDAMLIQAHRSPVEDLLKELAHTITSLTEGTRFRGADRFRAIEKHINILREKNWLNCPEFEQIIAAVRPCVITADEVPDKDTRNAHAGKVREAEAKVTSILDGLGL